jgi:hypothetical protein
LFNADYIDVPNRKLHLEVDDAELWKNEISDGSKGRRKRLYQFTPKTVQQAHI